jgi:hypothetical protein
MGVETVYAIMLSDNQRALNLTKKMGFKLEYLKDCTVKGVLDLKEEIFAKCPEPKSPQPTHKPEKQETLISEKTKKTAKPEAETAPL